MAHAVGATAVRLLQREERELACAIEVPLAVLVMDRERLHGGELPDIRESCHAADEAGLRQLDDCPPRGRRLGESPLPSMPESEPVERSPFVSPGLPRRRRRRRHAPRDRVAPAGALVHAAERERLGAVAAGLVAFARELHPPRHHRGQRHEVQPIVLEHRLERTRIAAAEEPEKAAGNLEARARPRPA